METYKKLLYWFGSACITAVVSAIQIGVDPRTDKAVMTWVCMAAVAGVIYAAAQTYTAVRRRDELSARHDALVDAALKVLLRQKLVSEHDRLVDLGTANDTQRRSWQASYETYEALCSATGDSNGVIDVYRKHVMDLPSDNRGGHR
jgi:hypothetical protein